VNPMPQRQLATIIADSISPAGVRLTTMEVVVPRIVLAEFNTHRVFSRNSASSRAIPIEKMIARVQSDPYMPERWGTNGKGMQDHGELSPRRAAWARRLWLLARSVAMLSAKCLLALDVHKQTTNRLLEPFMWHTIIVSATEWSNFTNLRCNPAAHPAIRETAEAMRVAMAESTPNLVGEGDWHLPYIFADDRKAHSTHELVKISCARCARISYLTHDGKRDTSEDLGLHDKLLAPGHMSPFEHAARPMTVTDVYTKLLAISGVVSVDKLDIDVREHFAGNFRGWTQYRKTIAGEDDILAHRGQG
jgi:hypothetical protein